MKPETKLLFAAVLVIAAFAVGVIIGQGHPQADAPEVQRAWCDGFEAGQLLASGVKRDIVGYGCTESVR